MRPKSWVIKELLKVTTDYLKEKQIESPRLTAEVLLAHQLNVHRVNLYLNFDQPLNESEISGYRALIRRRLRREPLQYITGVQEFWSSDFLVDQHVLIPRPESELLVEQTIKRLKSSKELHGRPLRILDLGTGCGALAVSLAKEVQDAQIWATDISAGAIKLARLNAEKHGVSDRIEFRQGELLQPLMKQNLIFDIILSNPPYVDSLEYNDLPPEVRDYEPRLALDGLEGGMYYIQRIIAESPDFLNPGGWLLLEMAPDQTGDALKLVGELKEAYGEKFRIKDYSQLYRVVCAQRVK